MRGKDEESAVSVADGYSQDEDTKAQFEDPKPSANNDTMNRDKSGRFDTGGGGAGRGRGMVKNKNGPDWACPSCANVNWCWRNNCNKCNGEKPKALQSGLGEARAGIGGGFLETGARFSTSWRGGI